MMVRASAITCGYEDAIDAAMVRSALGRCFEVSRYQLKRRGSACPTNAAEPQINLSALHHGSLHTDLVDGTQQRARSSLAPRNE